jgi:hypothetical protein
MATYRMKEYVQTYYNTSIMRHPKHILKTHVILYIGALYFIYVIASVMWS